MSPALAGANNGNWRTAQRWARHLSGHCRTRIVTDWQAEPCDLLIGLHARRSAAALARHARQCPHAPRVLVLTGTDVYRDIDVDPGAQEALGLATCLVALQDDAPARLPAPLRARCLVIHQSAPGALPLPRRAPARPLRVIQVGHLRDEKDPLTYLRAVRWLAHEPGLHFELVGEALQPELGDEARALMQECPQFRWWGMRPHHETRRRIAAADVLVNTSRMEGGAHVIIEAVSAGTAVLASRVGGNVGMLGVEHPGYFEVGDDAGLARTVLRCRDEPGFLAALAAHGARRAPLFDPERERVAVLHLVQTLLKQLLENPFR